MSEQKPIEAKATGRPNKLETWMIQKAEDFLSEGKSITQLGKELNVARSTIYKWSGECDAFSDALSIGAEFSQAHWEDKLSTEFMLSKEVNAPLVKLYFANRFNWHDKSEVKQEVTGANGGPLVICDDPMEAAKQYAAMMEAG